MQYYNKHLINTTDTYMFLFFPHSVYYNLWAASRSAHTHTNTHTHTKLNKPLHFNFCSLFLSNMNSLRDYKLWVKMNYFNGTLSWLLLVNMH